MNDDRAEFGHGGRRDARRDSVIAEHLPYEISMFQVCRQSLLLPQEQLLGNLLIDGFCLHARNLIDFLRGDGSLAADDVYARHFTDDKFRASASENLNPQLYGRLNAQVMHLSYGRFGAVKIGQVDRQVIAESIDKDLATFEQHLRPTYEKLWPPRT